MDFVFFLDKMLLIQYCEGKQAGIKAKLRYVNQEHSRKKERANAEKKAEILQKQGEKMRAKASKATAAQGMLRRAEKLRSNLEDVRVKDKVAKLRFPTPAPGGKTPLSGEELSKNYGSLEIFTDVSCVIDKGSRVVILGLNGAGVGKRSFATLSLTRTSSRLLRSFSARRSMP